MTLGVGETRDWETGPEMIAEGQMQGGEPGQGPGKGRFQDGRIIPRGPGERNEAERIRGFARG